VTTFSASEALQLAMEIETNGEAYYNALVNQGLGPEISELFKDLAIQERNHRRVFQKMLDTTPTAPSFNNNLNSEYREYLQLALDNALFAGKDKALLLAREARDRQTALHAALGFEKDTLLFFYDLREMVREKDRGAISGIIREEKAHVRRLASFL